MNRTLGRKILTFVALISIIAQSFSPYVAFSQKAYAQEATPTIEQPTPDQPTTTVTETPPADQTVTPTPTDQVTPQVTPTPTPNTTLTENPTPTQTPITVTPTPTNNLSPPGDSSTTVTPTQTPEEPTGNEQLNLIILNNVSAPSIDLEAVAESGSAVLTTDKPDYAPTDTALITGSNLLPNTTYSLTISSTDKPSTSTMVSVTSDNRGVFAYAYQLDGNYRPNYKAELRNSEGDIVASTTFTDVNAIGVITQPATGVTTTDATLNGTNGGANASQESFWVSTNTFSTASPTIPAGVYSTPVLPGVGAGVPFSDPLSLVTTNGIITGGVPGNMPAITPNTTYYFVAWSNVSGTWHPGGVLTFTTAPLGPVFIDTNVNGVLDPGEQTFTTIQAAVNAATSGDTIHVTAGTYTEIGQIVINKNLSIVGADKTTTIIKPGQDTSGTGDAGSWILVNDGITFNLSKVTLDGVGRQIRQGIRFNGSGVVDDVIIQNIVQTGYMGFAIVQGYDNATARSLSVTNSTFTNFGRVGIQTDNGTGGSTATISGNTFVGKGVGDHLDYAVTVEGGSVATITNNIISDCLGVASSDGSTSAGIAVTTYFAGGTTATITGNTISNSTDGIGVGYDASDTSIVVAHNNNLSGNIEHGVNSTAPTVDATNNWWGNASGPLDNKTLPGNPNYNNPSGAGSPVTSYVEYEPWFIDSAMATLSSANPITEAATGITLTSATLNGTNGNYDATNTSFWWGTTPAGSFSSCTSCGSQLPSGWTHDTGLGAESAGGSFNEALTSLTPGTQYYFVAWSEVGGTWYPGDVLTFSTVSPDTTAPPVPTLVSPANGSVKKPAGLILDWSNESDPSGPVTYKYKSSWSGGSYGPVSTGTTSQINASGSSDRVYSWQVQACDNLANCSAWSGPWQVTVDSVAPTLTQITPVSNPTNDATPNYIFSSNETGTISYGGDCSSSITTAVTGNNTVTFNTLSDGTHSNCTVTVTDAAGNNSAPLNVSSFTVDTLAPDAPNPISPTDGAAIKPVAFSQTWTAPAGAVQYKYQSCNIDPGDLGVTCTSVKFEQTLSGTTKNVGAGQPNSHFWWRVQAKDAAGNWSAYGKAFELFIDGTAPIPTSSSAFSLAFHGVNPKLITTYSCGSRTTAVDVYFDEDMDTTINPTVSFSKNVSTTLTKVSSIWYSSRLNSTTYDTSCAGQETSDIDITISGAKDLAGNVMNNYSLDTIGIDKIKPTVTSVDSDGKTFNIADMPSKAIKITFSEDVTKPTVDVLSAVGTPQIVSDCGDADAKTFCFDYTIPTSNEDTHIIHIQGAQDIAGNTMDFNGTHTFIVDTKAPTITGVTTTTANGAYTIGQVIDFEVSFNEAVNVSGGVPEFLVSAGPGRKAVYSSGSGTNTLTFNYTVGAADGTPTYLSHVDGNIALNGAAIKDLVDNDATLVLPNSSAFLAAHSIVIDTTAPTVAFTESNPQDGLLTGNNTQTFNVSVSEPVTSCTFKFNGNYSEVQIPNGLSDGLNFTPVISGDDNATMYTLPFSFPFYGNSYNVLSVSTNALLRFASSPDNSLSDSVSNLLSRIGIATLWDDLVTTVSVITSPNDARFRWTGTGWSTGGTLTNEAVLRSNGQVELHYGDVNLPSRNITAGLSAGNGLDYVLSSVNGQSVISPISFSYSPGGATGTYPMTIKSDGTYSVVVSGIADGTSHYSVTCADVATNEGKTDSRSINVDTTAPATPTANPSAGDYDADQLVALSSSDSGSGLDKIYYTIDGSSPDTSGTRISYPLNNSLPVNVDHDLTLKAIAYDNVGNASGVLEATYGVPPIISSEGSTSVTAHTATITWTTDDPSTSRVVYDTIPHPTLGLSPNYGYAFSTVEDPTKVTSHSVTLSGLTSSTTYYFRVISGGSPEATGNQKSFTTTTGFGLRGDGLSDGKSDGRSDGGSSAPQQSAVLGLAFAPGIGQDVLGTQTQPEVLGEATYCASPSPSISPTEAGQNLVSSSTNWVLSHLTLSFIILIILAIIAYFIYRKKKNK